VQASVVGYFGALNRKLGRTFGWRRTNINYAIHPVPVSDKTIDEEDRTLLERVTGQGDRDALGELFRRHADCAYRVALRVIGDKADAEDAVQTAFLRLMRLDAELVPDHSVRSWILAVVINASRMQRRAENRRSERHRRATDASLPNLSSAGTVACAFADDDQRRIVRDMLESLPERWRLPLALRYIEDMSYREIAETLKVKQKTIESQVQRGLMKLREKLERAGLPAGLAVAAWFAPLRAEAAPAQLTLTAAPRASAITAASTTTSSWLAAAAALSLSIATWAMVQLSLRDMSTAGTPIDAALKRIVNADFVRDHPSAALGRIHEWLPRELPFHYAVVGICDDVNWTGISYQRTASVRDQLDYLCASCGLTWRVFDDGNGLLLSKPMPAARRKLLLRIVDDPQAHAAARAEAIERLAHSGDEPAAAALLARIHRLDPELSLRAEQSLDRAWNGRTRALHERSPLAAWRGNSAITNAVAAAMAAHPNDILSDWCGWLGISSAREALSATVADPSARPESRRIAARALARIGNRQDRRILANAAEREQDVYIRLPIAAAAAQLGDRGSVDLLYATMRNVPWANDEKDWQFLNGEIAAQLLRTVESARVDACLMNTIGDATLLHSPRAIALAAACERRVPGIESVLDAYCRTLPADAEVYAADIAEAWSQWLIAERRGVAEADIHWLSKTMGNSEPPSARLRALMRRLARTTDYQPSGDRADAASMAAVLQVTGDDHEAMAQAEDLVRTHGLGREGEIANVLLSLARPWVIDLMADLMVEERAISRGLPFNVALADDVAIALGRMHNPTAVAALRHIAVSGKRNDRLRALLALTYMRSPLPLLPLLREQLASFSDQAANEAIMAILDHAAAALRDLEANDVTPPAQATVRNAVASMRTALTRADGDDRLAALLALRCAWLIEPDNDAELSNDMKLALRDDDLRVRICAAMGLSDREHAGCADALREFLASTTDLHTISPVLEALERRRWDLPIYVRGEMNGESARVRIPRTLR
jgi:RNA polymerase sigma-70 factor, ECF subfamily